MLLRAEKSNYAIAIAAAQDLEYVQLNPNQQALLCSVCEGCGLYQGRLCLQCFGKGYWKVRLCLT
jgi:hypothetical protein